ncbi:hypothetical protein [Nocardia africana]
MAYAKLYYGGHEHKLDAEQAAVFLMAVKRALQSGDAVHLVEAPLVGGKVMSIAVSPSIPIGIERGGSDSGPSAAFA